MTLIDVLDIAIFAALIYGLIILLKKTGSLVVVFGIIIVSAIYALAEFFNFRLTVATFHLFFSVLLIAMVVIFQAELRRYFEMIALWGGALRTRPKKQAEGGLVEHVASVAERFAKEKIGMLVVIRGHEPIARHVTGGFELNGKISEPLLESIFDASSPGHDGAVIIEEGLITKFGGHLPLSEDFGQIESYGTRHSAGLGLAEVSDALAIIVSEEKGTISVAQNGRLETMRAEGGVAQIIKKFMEEKFVAQKRMGLDGVAHIKEKILAVALAVVAWLMFASPYT